jgi:hypothetical protein
MTTRNAELLVIPSEVPTLFEVGTESRNLMLPRARRSLDKRLMTSCLIRHSELSRGISRIVLRKRSFDKLRMTEKDASLTCLCPQANECTLVNFPGMTLFVYVT